MDMVITVSLPLAYISQRQLEVLMRHTLASVPVVAVLGQQPLRLLLGLAGPSSCFAV